MPLELYPQITLKRPNGKAYNDSLHGDDSEDIC